MFVSSSESLGNSVPVYCFLGSTFQCLVLNHSKESFRVVVYCSIIKVLCVVAVLATAHLYYHKRYRFVNNFFYFFVFPFVISAHDQVAVLTTNVIIS